MLYVIDTTFPLNMNMHYTAFSRAKNALHLVGSREHFNGRKARLKEEVKNSFIESWLEQKC